MEDKYQVNFKMMSKVDVKGGKIHPVWKYILGKTLNLPTSLETC